MFKYFLYINNSMQPIIPKRELSLQQIERANQMLLSLYKPVGNEILHSIRMHMISSLELANEAMLTWLALYKRTEPLPKNCQWTKEVLKRNFPEKKILLPYIEVLTENEPKNKEEAQEMINLAKKYIQKTAEVTNGKP